MSTQDKNLDSVLSEIRRMLDLNNQVNAEARKRGEKYNIFEILGEKYSELAHSAFLANIINPKGSHALGYAPLRSFLNIIGIKGWNDTDISNAEVNIEEAIKSDSENEWGRMDIVIKSNDKIIIIENKIYAGDQPMQLKRYKSYAESHFKQNHTLLYLTLGGHQASDSSADNLREGIDYLTISYKKEILNLINECVKLAVQKPLVREVLIQYQSVVENLTGKNDIEKKEVFDYILQHSDTISRIFTDERYVKEREHILNLYPDDFFHYGLQHLASELKAFADTKGLKCDLNDMFSGGRYSGFSFKKEGWVKTIPFQFTMPYWKGCYYGVHSLSEVSPGEKMKHLKFKQNDHYCYGHNFTNYKNWDLKGLISGEIKESIIDAIERTIEAIDREPDKYLM